MIDDENLTVAQQQHLKQAQKKLAELKKRMGYEVPPLSEEEQNQLDAKFHNAARMRRWIE
jgi:hypothetical protein